MMQKGLKSIAIPLAGGDVIHLSDVANVYSAVKDADSIGRYNGDDVNFPLGNQKSSRAPRPSMFPGRL